MYNIGRRGSLHSARPEAYFHRIVNFQFIHNIRSRWSRGEERRGVPTLHQSIYAVLQSTGRLAQLITVGT